MPLFKDRGMEYIMSEYEGPGSGDMQRINYSDRTVDWVISHHVLEHIQDDRLALSEVHRVLKPGGVFHLAVPVNWELERTTVFSEATERNHDHWREYGCDVTELLSNYRWRRVDLSSDLPREHMIRYGLDFREPFFELTKTGDLKQ